MKLHGNISQHWTATAKLLGNQQ